MSESISPLTLKSWLRDGDEIALFDVREDGQFGEGHLFFAAPLPYSRLEIDAPRLAPRKSVRTVLVDHGDGLAQRAARRLGGLGYRQVATLEGGIHAWAAAGFALFKGVNVPSKTFGELVEQAYHTPHIPARRFVELRNAGGKLALLDGRTLEEHHKMTIPDSISVPNGELAYRLRALVPDEDTTIVIHCAGRTRSIIGAQTLRNLGIRNQVLALENGTQGWALAGLTLEQGSTRRYPERVPDNFEHEQRAASELVRRFKIPVLGSEEAQQWLDDPARTTYLFDIRTAQEFAERTLPGARHAPGGQLIQATDQYVGVRNSRVIVLDGEGIRAPVVASWLHQLGFDCAILEEGIHAALRVEPPAQFAPENPLPRIDGAGLRRLAAAGAPPVLIDLRPSQAYRQTHVVGATWSIRPVVAEWLARTHSAQAPIVLIADAPERAELAAVDLREAGYARLYLAEQGLDALEAAGFMLESSPSIPAREESIDYLFFVHDRHEGNLQAAQQYLDWETGLIAQCDADELEVFRLPEK